MSEKTQRYFPSPYRFVPLAERPLLPSWGPYVSHDVPFQDGLSGKIKLEIKALTPLFTRHDGEKGKEETAFFHIDGTPAIKSSSLKGMLRNDLKITTFGRMNRADERYFGVRDLSDAAKDTYRKLLKQVEAGWWEPEDNFCGGRIIPCKFARIRGDKLEEYHNSRSHPQWSFADPDFQQRQQNWSIERGVSVRLSKGKVHDQASDLGNGPTRGTIVFTGYIPGKKKEFFFHSKKPQEALTLSENVVEKFHFAHSGTQQNASMGLGARAVEPNPQLAYWIEQSRRDPGRGRIPVFYILDRDGQVEAFGLAMMFRFYSKSSVHNAIRQVDLRHLDAEDLEVMGEALPEHHGPDLADLLFGYANQKEALKGRVSIEPALLQGNQKSSREEEALLGSPQPSFYPAYLQQAPEGPMNDWLCTNAKPAGWKIYPTQSTAKAKKGKASEKLTTKFAPLPAGSKFYANVFYHNLLPEELGALLWLFDYGGMINGLVHRLGLAKPYGFGSVKLRPLQMTVQPNDPNASPPHHPEKPLEGDGLRTLRAGLIDDFERMLVKEHFGKEPALDEEGLERLCGSTAWVHHLAAMNPGFKDDPRLTNYPILDAEKKIDEFRDAKNQTQRIPPIPGIDQTRKELQEYAKKRFKSWQESLTQDERLQLECDKMSEEEAYEKAKNIEQEPDEKLRSLWRDLLAAKYYEKWLRGRGAIQAGKNRQKEVAQKLRPDAEKEVPRAGQQNAEELPFSATFQALIDEVGNDQDALLQIFDNVPIEEWEEEALQALQKKAKNLLPKANKIKGRKKEWLETLKQELKERKA